MSSKDKRSRKRPASGQSFVNQLREEVESSFDAEQVLENGFREMCSADLLLDMINNLPSAALSAYVAAKYEQHVVSYIEYFIPELRLLLSFLRIETINIVTGISHKDASVLFKACSMIRKTQPTRIGASLKDLCRRGYPLLLLSPTSKCLNCEGELSQHNKPCQVTVYSLEQGKAIGLKFSLRCEKCKVNYNYDRYQDMETRQELDVVRRT